MHKFAWILTALVVLTVILAACAGDSQDTEDLPEADVSSDVPEEINVVDGRLSTEGYSIDVPEGWATVAGEGILSGVILITNQDEIDAEAAFAGLTDESAIVAIYFFAEGMALIETIEGDNATLAETVSTLFTTGESSSSYDFESIETVEIDGRDAVLFRTVDQTALVYVVEVGEDFYMLLGETSTGNLATFEQDMRSIIESVDFN
ncbi:MAG: hypothetical protein GYB64_00500 [Chloroflexi bacterium]|nr:hypothetical protein [Chloroflexota bacterium]